MAISDGCPFLPEIRREVDRGQPRHAVLFPSFLFILPISSLNSQLLSYPCSSIPASSCLGPCQVSSDFLDAFLLPKAEYCTQESKGFPPFFLELRPHIDNCHQPYSLQFGVLCQGVEILQKLSNSEASSTPLTLQSIAPG